MTTCPVCHGPLPTDRVCVDFAPAEAVTTCSWYCAGVQREKHDGAAFVASMLGRADEVAAGMAREVAA